MDQAKFRTLLQQLIALNADTEKRYGDLALRVSVLEGQLSRLNAAPPVIQGPDKIIGTELTPGEKTLLTVGGNLTKVVKSVAKRLNLPITRAKLIVNAHCASKAKK